MNGSSIVHSRSQASALSKWRDPAAVNAVASAEAVVEEGAAVEAVAAVDKNCFGR